MKTKSIKKVTVIAMAAALLALNSCQKEKQTLQTQTTGTDLSFGGRALNESQIAVNALASSTNSNKMESILSSCATSTNDTVSKPHVYTIDYGAGCVGSDGITRSGKIILTYNSTDVRLINNAWNTTFQNFVVGNDAISGTIKMRNAGHNANGNLHYPITVNVTDNNSGNVTQTSANLNCEWIAGEATQTTSDDNFSVTGSITGKNHLNQLYNGSITSALIKTAACNNQYVQGTISYTATGQATKTYDYGNGTCTGNVTITQSGVSTTQPQDGSLF